MCLRDQSKTHWFRLSIFFLYCPVQSITFKKFVTNQGDISGHNRNHQQLSTFVYIHFCSIFALCGVFACVGEHLGVVRVSECVCAVIVGSVGSCCLFFFFIWSVDHIYMPLFHIEVTFHTHSYCHTIRNTHTYPPKRWPCRWDHLAQEHIGMLTGERNHLAIGPIYIQSNSSPTYFMYLCFHVIVGVPLLLI